MMDANHGLNLYRHMRMDVQSEIRSPEEFDAAVQGLASGSAFVSRMKDPEVRRGADLPTVRHVTEYAGNVSSDIGAVKEWFRKQNAAGEDTSADEAKVREILDHYELGALFDTSSSAPPEVMQSVGKAYQDWAKNTSPSDADAVSMVQAIDDAMGQSRSVGQHGTLSTMLDTAVDRYARSGEIPQPLIDAIRGMENDRFGSTSLAQNRVALYEAAQTGDGELVSDLSNGEQALIKWNPENTELSTDVIVDDRSNTSGRQYSLGNQDFQHGMDQITPNVAAALNSLFAAYGGGIHRTDDNITQASTSDAQQWREGGWQRDNGSDTRGPDRVTGVYSPTTNNIIVADATFREGSKVNTLTHELGHALDSTLGTLGGGRSFGYDTWFSETDPEFKAFRAKLMETSSYGSTGDATLLNWYFLNESDYAQQHNGRSGGLETWAQGYASYAMMRESLAYGENRTDVLRRGGSALLYGKARDAEREGGLDEDEIEDRLVEAGNLIFKFFDDFENKRLPEIMKNPSLARKRQIQQSPVVQALGAPAPKSDQTTPNLVQTTRASSHRYNGQPITMVELRPGTQGYDTTLAAMREKNPHLNALPEDTIALWHHRDWESATDGTLLLKIVRAGKDTPTNVYDYMHEKKSNAQKFQREKAVHKVHKQLREKALSEALDDPIAAMVATMADSGMRVDDAKGQNRTKSVKRKKVEQVFGASSLMPKHLTFNENSVRIDFMGKSGVDNRYTVKDPRLIEALKKWSEGKGDDEFIFGDTTADQSIDYLRNATGITDMINHDLRTYMANAVVHQWLENLPGFKKTKGKTAKQIKDDPFPARPKKGMTQAEFDNFKVKGWKQAGVQLNDGWTTVRDNYVSPYVWYSLEQELGLNHSWDELIDFTGVPAHPGPTNVPAPPSNVPDAPTNVPIAAAAAPTPQELEEVQETPVVPVEFDEETYRALDDFYSSVEWPTDPAAPTPAPMFTESLPEGDEVE